MEQTNKKNHRLIGTRGCGKKKGFCKTSLLYSTRLAMLILITVMGISENQAFGSIRTCDSAYASYFGSDGHRPENTRKKSLEINSVNQGDVLSRLKRKSKLGWLGQKTKNLKDQIDFDVPEVFISDCTQTTSLLRAMEKLSSLEDLTIQESKINKGSIKAIAELPLKSLNLRGLKIEGLDISSLRKLESLRALYLGQNNLPRKSLDHLLTLKGLEKLDLSSNNLDPEFIFNLRALTSLKELSLDHNTQIKFQHLRALKDLPIEVLYLRDTGISSKDIEKIALEFRYLKALYVGGIYIDHDDIEAAQILNPDLDVNADFSRIKLN